jgi:hypothetical protein
VGDGTAIAEEKADENLPLKDKAVVDDKEGTLKTKRFACLLVNITDLGDTAIFLCHCYFLLVLSHTVIVLADSAGRLTNYAVFPCIRAGSTKSGGSLKKRKQ